MSQAAVTGLKSLSPGARDYREEGGVQVTRCSTYRSTQACDAHLGLGGTRPGQGLEEGSWVKGT